MKKAILFDLDGTLWDSSREVAISWSMALEPYGIKITHADVQSVMGKTLDEIAGIVLPDKSDEERRRILAACSDCELDYLRQNGASPFPGLEETLEALSRDYALCIVSNCQEGYIETFLNYYSLEKYFVDTENAGRTGRPKGENIRLVAERNGFDAVLYVGDTQKDCDAAGFAGVPFLHAAYGFGTIDHEVPRLEALSDLPVLVKQLFP